MRDPISELRVHAQPREIAATEMVNHHRPAAHGPFVFFCLENATARGRAWYELLEAPVLIVDVNHLPMKYFLKHVYLKDFLYSINSGILSTECTTRIQRHA